jgi:hypothetical protein
MNVRLIKPGISPTTETDKARPDEVQIIDTIRAWVHEFRSGKAHKARLGFRRIENPEKTSS